MAGRLSFRTVSETETFSAGEALAAAAEPGDVIALAGDLGAGKTVLVRGLASGLGVTRPVTSPTFNILVVHGTSPALNHFDLYRLEHERELEDIDFWGVLESGGISAIEWGDRFPGALPPERLEVVITIEDAERRFEVKGSGVRGQQLAQAWIDTLEGAAS